MKPTVAVTIVTYNAEHDIKPCLDSLYAQTRQPDEIIIVDNASADHTIAIIEEGFPSVSLIKNTGNEGFGRAHNKAIHAAKSSWVLVLNQDAVLEADMLEKLMSRTADGSVASIGPLLLRSKNENPEIDSAGMIKLPYYKVIDQYAGKPLSECNLHSGPVWGISGACALYKKAALENIAHPRTDRSYPEYFDEHFFMYKEDVDLAGRLQSRGYSAWFEAGAIAYHRRTGRAEANLATMRAHRKQRAQYISLNSYRNHLFFLFKQVPLVALPLVFPYELIKLFYLALFERDTLSILPQTLKALPVMIKRRYV